MVPPLVVESGTTLEAALAAVRNIFERQFAGAAAPVQPLIDHISHFRGKMLRPMLVLLSGLASRGIPEISDEHIVLATVVEMIHLATLVHDDVLDNADVRRRAATINHLRGNQAAVLLGDMLISHAFHLCSSLESQSYSRLIGQTTNLVCEGELIQNLSRQNWELTEDTYLDIIYRKTGSLIEASCRLGAMASTENQAIIEALARYGRGVGMAFQIIDDVLDITGSPKVVGKSLGTDIEQGKLTLPMIHFLACADRPHRDLLINLLESSAPDRIDHVRKLIQPSDSIAYSCEQAQNCVDQAIAAIGVLPQSESKVQLIEMAEFVTARDK